MSFSYGHHGKRLLACCTFPFLVALEVGQVEPPTYFICVRLRSPSLLPGQPPFFKLLCKAALRVEQKERSLRPVFILQWQCELNRALASLSACTLPTWDSCIPLREVATNTFLSKTQVCVEVQPSGPPSPKHQYLPAGPPHNSFRWLLLTGRAKD